MLGCLGNQLTLIIIDASCSSVIIARCPGRESVTIDLVALFAATVLAGGDSRVSSFYNAGDAASIDGDNCVPFDSKYNAVAVNFGTNIKETTSLSVFSSSNCENHAGDDITLELEAGTPQ